MTLLDVLHPSVEHDSVDGVEAITLAAGALEATFVPEVGMVGTSLRHAGAEVLDLRAGLQDYRDRGAVMGLPLLHPWANRLGRDELFVGGRRVRLSGSALVRRDEHGLPIHGLLGAHPGWSVHEVDADGHAARLIAGFDFAADPRLLDAFPFPHELVVEATLSADSLRIATTVRATGAVAVPIAFGYHPYLRLPEVDRTDWRLHLPRRRHLALDAAGLPTGASRDERATELRLGERGFDDGYDGLQDGAGFAVIGGGREIVLTHERGYPVAQVFSPPGAPFICFEPMTAPTNALCDSDGLRFVAPGESFTAAFSIRVRRC